MTKSKNSKYQGQGLAQVTGLGVENWGTEATNRLIEDLGPFRIKIAEYVVHGEIYYEAAPVGWMLVEDGPTWRDMMVWVTETFSSTANDGVWTSGQRWYANNSRFYFRNVEDRDWFILKWSN
jgi:hypothetical protein